MSITDFRRSSPAVLVGTAYNSYALGGVTVSSNGIATDGWVLVATGSNSAIWRNALAFGSNTNDVGSVGTMGASSSNSRADHVHRGVSAVTAAGSNALYGSVNLVAGTGVAITAAGNNVTIAGQSTIASGTYVEARNFGSEVVSTTSVSGTHTINGANGNWHDVTLTGNTTFSFTGATSGEGDSFVLILRQNATGGYTATWPGSVVWTGGTAPSQTTTANNVSVYTFFSRNGGTIWYGFIAGTGTSIGVPSLASNTFSEMAITNDASLAITSPTDSSIHMSAPFVSEVVTDAGEIVWHGSDVVHTLVRIY